MTTTDGRRNGTGSVLGGTAGGCPDDHLLAAWADERLEETRAEVVEAHLSECDACRATATDLRAAVREDAALGGGGDAIPAALPSLDAARARRFHPGAWAIAAAVLLAVGAGVALLAKDGDRAGPKDVDGRLAAAADDLRRADPALFADFRPAPAEERRSVARDAMRAMVVVLKPAGTVLEERPRLSWSGAGADAFEVTLAGPDGQDLWRRRVAGTEAEFPKDAPALIPGTRYVLAVAPVSGGVVDGQPATRGFRIASAAEAGEWRRVVTSVERGAPADLRALLLAHAAARRELLLEADARAGDALAASGAGAVASETREWVRARLRWPAEGAPRGR